MLLLLYLLSRARALALYISKCFSCYLFQHLSYQHYYIWAVYLYLYILQIQILILSYYSPFSSFGSINSKQHNIA